MQVRELVSTRGSPQAESRPRRVAIWAESCSTWEREAVSARLSLAASELPPVKSSSAMADSSRSFCCRLAVS